LKQQESTGNQQMVQSVSDAPDKPDFLRHVLPSALEDLISNSSNVDRLIDHCTETTAC
jgi:hypothetical protein